jgi:hypothetical protein
MSAAQSPIRWRLPKSSFVKPPLEFVEVHISVTVTLTRLLVKAIPLVLVILEPAMSELEAAIAPIVNIVNAFI